MSKTSPEYILRPPVPGDWGWIIHRHGVIYSTEFGWTQNFEGLVAEVIGRYILGFNVEKERCWVAEKDGQILGSVFVAQKSPETAQLRMLYVEKAARGLGLGRRLVSECIEFSKLAGYHRLSLWTNDVLTPARKLYEDFGFRLVNSEPHQKFGPPMVGETWELVLPEKGSIQG